MQWDAVFALVVAVALFGIGMNAYVFIPCEEVPCNCPLDLNYLLCLASCGEIAAETWICGKIQFVFSAGAMVGGLFCLIMSVIGALS